nr:MAG TPA: hypothetical protein [Bacteriophage sp.]
MNNIPTVAKHLKTNRKCLHLHNQYQRYWHTYKF